MLTNIYPINIPFEEFNIFRIKFDKDLRNELRKNFNENYSFFRNGDFLYISSDIEAPINIGEKLVKLKVEENTEIISSLIKHIFFRNFIRLFGVTPLSFYPLKFISRIKEHDVLDNLIPKELGEKLGYKRQVEIQFRQIEIQNELKHCAVYNIGYKWFFSKSCYELFREKFELRKLDVVHSVPILNAESVLAPEEVLVGTIQNVFEEGKEVFAEVETNEGTVKYDAKELFLEKSRHNIENYLKSKFGERETQRIYQKIADSKVERVNLKSLQNEIQKLAKPLAKPQYNNKDGFVFNISDNSNLPENSFDIYKPTYIFDDDDFQKDNNPYFGITKFGPSDKSYFYPKQLKVLVICHSQNRAVFSNFISTLEKGLPNKTDKFGNTRFNYFADGLAGKYKIHKISFELEEIQDYKSQTYLSVINNFLKQGTKPDLVILEIKQEFKSLGIVENPYYQVKANLLSQAIPIQFIDKQTIIENRVSEAFFNLISIQMYAKLGGIPWALPKRGSYDKEIVIGVGSHLERKNKFSKNESTKVVGISTFFSGEGRYLFGNRCKEVDYDDYFNELLINLKTSIEEVSKEYNWQKDSTILIIFHIFKPIKKVEAQVVEKLISQFTQFKIKYAFLTISDNHPFILFDSKQRGDRFGKGEYLPEKGANLKLNDSSCLIQSRSVEDVKSNKHGMPKPLLISLIPSEDLEINFRDLNHLTQQIFNFSNLSFSTFSTSNLPVTILYSDKIAKWLSRLRKIQGWNPQVVNTELKKKKWFL